MSPVSVCLGHLCLYFVWLDHVCLEPALIWTLSPCLSGHCILATGAQRRLSLARGRERRTECKGNVKNVEEATPNKNTGETNKQGIPQNH